MTQDIPIYASRAGVKLQTALEAFELDVAGLTCADLGCSTGGFVDCLLQRGAKHVYAVDTAYGELAWKLRQDPRVTVLERSNALHLEPLAVCGLVTVDLGWTPQRLAIPAASRWLGGNPDGRIISLVKPHYEASSKAFAGKKRGKLDDDQALAVADRVIQELEDKGFSTIGRVQSPIRGGKGGNLEVLALVRGTPAP
jgi:23S rRNA (cytidine1920-2'-O)/16S rRNA (cytidine1409-2'-O)-methyltransferase